MGRGLFDLQKFILREAGRWLAQCQPLADATPQP
jgi:hypothetical protein